MENKITITQSQLSQIIALLSENYANLQRIGEILADITDGSEEEGE